MKFTNFFKKIIPFFLFIFIFSFYFPVKKANAGFVKVFDDYLSNVTEQIGIGDKEREATRKAEKQADEEKETLWSKLLHSTIGKALNTIAYDTATWLGSGGQGQKPMFITEGWGEYMQNIGDQAFGNFIETLGKEGPIKFNLCKPDFLVQMKIGLGLTKQERPSAPKCTFSQMKDNWDKAIHDENFLNDFQDMFEPTSSDLAIALSLQTKVINDVNLDLLKMTKMREESKGWLDLRDISGRIESVPGLADRTAWKIEDHLNYAMNTVTGSLLTDAANVFINQLAITGIQTLMKTLAAGTNTYTSPFDWSSLMDFNAQPHNGGIGAAKEKLKKIIEPKFDTRGDYDILSQLSLCPPSDKSERIGPTDCVIDDKFRQAIQEKVTVGNAMKQGYLNPGFVFGFQDDKGQEPYFKEGYPYRSMIILRNYRILPVGWELAAQYIRKDGTVDNTLGGMVACFDPDDDYEGYSADWCEGLVDPNWVLKAPQNYCRREGPGPQIASHNVSGKNEKSELLINRNDEYCADNWACIQEEDDGSCRYYGYCTEEKRGWRFNAESCESNYNTCQTYRKRDGQTMSVLENTLDYRNCNIDNVGCMAYSITYDDYNSETNDVSWNGEDNIYFDKDAKECDESNEGCHEFIRIKPGIGANLMIRNASFEDFIGQADDDVLDSYDWFNDFPESSPSPGLIGKASSDSYEGLVSIMEPNYAGALFFMRGESFSNLVGQSATFSFYAKDCTESDLFFVGAQYAFNATPSIIAFNPAIERVATGTLGLVQSDGWVRYAATYKYSKDDYSNPQVPIYAGVRATGNCKIDASKIELGDEATPYSDYREQGLVYQKMLPSYLESTCYKPADGEGFIYAQDDAPEICNNFTRTCTEGEFGCQLYTSLTDEFTVPAKISVQDECPAECVGFDTYLQTETFFEDESEQYFIPKTAQKCNAQFVGCDEFTNLDEVEQGGEGKEYYTYVRMCRNPDDQCSSFYTWEGSAETGYQLKIYNLERDGSGPRLTNLGQYNGLDCDADSYDLEANPACREFYSVSGQVFYRFYPYTITCSEDCHPLRKTANDTQVSCENHGGEWDSGEGACIYMAIPSQGITCNASQAGCREYSGNTGNNKRIISQNNFEGSAQGWEGVGTTNASLSSESLMMGGNSLFVSDGSRSARLNIGDLVEEEKLYVVQFIAKPATTLNTDVSFEFSNGTDSTNFGSVTLKEGVWFNFELNIASLDITVDGDTNLIITGTNNFYIDDIKLVEITNRYYLIKDSWTFPMRDEDNNWCEWDLVSDEASALYSLGCDAYKDQDNKGHYLRQFSKLCPESSAGCEPVVDTYNYTPYFGSKKAWNDDDNNDVCATTDDDCVKAEFPEYKLIVYNKNKKCNAKDKGCERFGQEIMYDGDTLYLDKWLINDLDSYDQILCTEDATFCEEWSNQASLAYFKDPGDQLCEWRQSPNEPENSGWDWFKTKIKKCDNGAGGGSANDGVITASLETDICFSNRDCGLGISCESDDQCGSFKCVQGECRADCILDENDYSCLTSSLKTIGYSGTGGRVEQPTNSGDTYWVGLCPGDQAGCAEYIDPISNFNMNLIFNAKFKDLDGDDSITSLDGWLPAGGGYRQNGKVTKQNTLYRLGGIGAEAGNSITIDCADSFYRITRSNGFLDEGDQYTLNFAGNDEESALLYLVGENSCDISVGGAMEEAIFKEAIIDYRLKQEVDRQTCNGTVDPGDGCVLFNERVRNGSGILGLRYDADLSPTESGIADSCEDVDCDSNVVLKVSPDRDCATWIDCLSYYLDENLDPVCSQLVKCDSLDDSGECNGVVVEPAGTEVNQIYDPAEPDHLDQAEISNKTGYTKIGYFDTGEGFVWQNDLYPYTAMVQEGNIVNIHIFNGSFEQFKEDDDDQYDEENKVAARQPIEWNLFNGGDWTPGNFNVISDPVTSQNKGISFNRFIYAPEGKSYLQYDSTEAQTSPMNISNIQVFANTDYVISAWVNTQSMRSTDPDIEVGAVVEVVPYNSDDLEVIDAIYNYELDEDDAQVITAPAGKDWTFYITKFKTDDNVNSIRLHLKGRVIDGEECTSVADSAMCSGPVYIDDIKIMPALHIRDEEDIEEGEEDQKMEKEYLSQTCRLYPSDDAFSCDYYEDSGIRMKGWWGYCLEYDRYPGDENSCLQWWPVDRILGDNPQEQTVGYDGRTPMYYCLAEEEEQLYEYRHAFMTYRRDSGREIRACERSLCPTGYHPVCGNCEKRDDYSTGKTDYAYCVPIPAPGAIYDTGAPNVQSSRPGDCRPTTHPDWSGSCDITECCVWSTSNEYNGSWCDGRVNTDADGWYPVDAISVDLSTFFWTINDSDNDYAEDWPWGEDVYYLHPYCYSDICRGVLTGQELVASEWFNNYAGSLADLQTAIGAGSFPRYYCSEFAQTVQPAGENMYWAGRVNRASDYYFPCDDEFSSPPNGEADGVCEYNDDYIYYGSIVYPADGAEDPSSWDSKPDDGQQPVYFEAKAGDPNPGQVRAGALHTGGEEVLKRIFADSYSAWKMSEDHIGGSSDPTMPRTDTYQRCGTGFTGEDGCLDDGWNPPQYLCRGTDGARPVWQPGSPIVLGTPPDPGTCDGGSCYCDPEAIPTPTCDFCGVPPRITNIKINRNNLGRNIIISAFKSTHVEITFNSFVDIQQFPLMEIEIDWGYGENYKMGDLNISNAPNEGEPHSVFHDYSYAAAKVSLPSASCPDNCSDIAGVEEYTGPCCVIKPSVKIKDNWGWCNGGRDGAPCPNVFEEFGSWLILTP